MGDLFIPESSEYALQIFKKRYASGDISKGELYKNIYQNYWTHH